MKLIIKLFGVLVILAGLSMIFYTEILFAWLRDVSDKTSFYISVVAIRLVFGVIILFSAKQSKYPGILKFVGGLMFLAALVFIFLGLEKSQKFFVPIITELKPYAAVWGLVAVFFGTFLIYVFSGKKKNLDK